MSRREREFLPKGVGLRIVLKTGVSETLFETHAVYVVLTAKLVEVHSIVAKMHVHDA